MKHCCLTALLLIALLTGVYRGAASTISPDTVKTRGSDSWIYNILNIAGQKAMNGAVVKVAVVDDGFRLSHKSLRDFIYTNELDPPGNFQDDDRNGHVDDIHGWDISDNDADVSVPVGRERSFYHGTYIAGIIVSIFQKYYGEDAKKILRIIPVKVLSDHAQNTYLVDGYKGISYAAGMGADIICCAWSGGQISEEEKTILDGTIAKGIIIVGAAGNLYSEKVEPPSSWPGVFCVAALDSLLHKSRYSNFGMRIDISAPGDSVYGPHPLADNAFIHENGTSPATAIITGCAAILKALAPGASSEEIYNALRNTATPVDSLNLTFCGKLGSGLPDMTKAIAYMEDPDYKFSSFLPSRPEGTVFFRKKKSPLSWEIRPSGAYKGIHIKSRCSEPKKEIMLYAGDSLWYEGPIGTISKWVFIPGSRFKIELQPGSTPKKDLEVNYFMETIDSTTLYCHGIQYLIQENGTLSDGSGVENYANNCSCKWQITVPENKRIRIEVPDMDTQPNIDFIWIFDGTATLQENLLAKFSGTSVPPVITSYSNKILLWFSTDNHITGKGWTMNYSSVDQ